MGRRLTMARLNLEVSLQRAINKAENIFQNWFSSSCEISFCYGSFYSRWMKCPQILSLNKRMCPLVKLVKWKLLLCVWLSSEHSKSICQSTAYGLGRVTICLSILKRPAGIIKILVWKPYSGNFLPKITLKTYILKGFSNYLLLMNKWCHWMRRFSISR